MRRPPAASGRQRGVTRLMYAAQQGDVDEVRRLVREQPASVLARDRHLQTALHYCAGGAGAGGGGPALPAPSSLLAGAAARRAHAADVIAGSAPHLVDARDDDGLTPLHLAVVAGNTQLVNFLLANGADPAAVDNERHTAVHWATVCGETAALRAVLQAGAPVSTPDIHGGYPLHYAAQMCGGDKDPQLGLQVLSALLAHPGADVHAADGARRPPLLWAASAGAARAALALVAAGARPDAADRDGLAALHCAASRGHADVLDALLTLCGATVDLIDGNGCTALHYSVTLGHADATALLLAHGADPNRQDRKGRSPAHCGCAKGQFETVKLIAANGANLWLKNARGDLPLHDAAASGRRDLVKWLLDMRPSQVNARNNDGRCPLHMAALNDNSDMCKILLDAGANVNPILRTSKNVLMTPLDCALQRGFRSTAKFLQLHGGVPASRLGPQGAHQQTSTPNYQIREDVTFYGESSSESDREANKGRKRSFKKRQSRRKERRKEEASDSEEDTPKKKTPEVKSSSSRIDYTNEIIINGKTEINFHQTKEISIEKDATSPRVEIDTSEKVVIPQTKFSASEKRPKSAKHGKAREKSSRPTSAKKKLDESKSTKFTTPKSSIEEAQVQKEESVEVTAPKEPAEESKTPKEDAEEPVEKTERIRSRTELRRSFSLREPSTNTSEETSDTVVDAFKYKPLTKEDEKSEDDAFPDTKMGLPDQQSITSEEIEQPKSVVAEVSVHAPPKELEDATKDEITTEDTKEVEKETPASNDVPEKDVEESIEGCKGNEEVVTEKPAEGSVNKEEEIEKLEEYVVKTQEKTETEGSTAIEAEEELKDDITKEDQKESEALAVEESAEKSEVTEAEDEEKLEAVTESQIEEVKELSNQLDKLEAESQLLLKENVEKCATEAEEVQKDLYKKKKLKKESKDHSLENGDVKGKSKKAIQKSKEDTKAKNKDDLVVETEIVDKQRKKVKTVPSPDKEVAQKKDINKGTRKSKIVSPSATEAKKKPDGKTKKTSKKKTVSIEEDSLEADDGSKRKRSSSREKPKEEKETTDYSEEEAEEGEEVYTSFSEGSSPKSQETKDHKSFRVLDEEEASKLEKPKSKRKSRKSKSPARSKSDETKFKKEDKAKKTRIPAPLFKTTLSKSDRHLDRLAASDRKARSSLAERVPSLPSLSPARRPASNMSAPPPGADGQSDEEGGRGGRRVSQSEDEADGEGRGKRRRQRRRRREARSAGSDYESSNLIDSGFEPSPRSSRIPKWRNVSDRGVNMESVTQSIQNNIRRYHLERKIFQHLLELKRSQIRAGQHNEAVLVKRAIEQYHRSCASTVGSGRYASQDFTFRAFEKFLYDSLRKLQRADAAYLKGLPAAPPENPNPLLCARSTHRCSHAAHAYTGVPCAAYLPKMDHHSIPKIGFEAVPCKPGTAGFLPNINQKKGVTLELSHGADKQIISLPADRLDQNKRYYVTFTVKGREPTPPSEESSVTTTAHRHSKSD